MVYFPNKSFEPKMKVKLPTKQCIMKKQKVFREDLFCLKTVHNALL